MGGWMAGIGQGIESGVQGYRWMQENRRRENEDARQAEEQRLRAEEARARMEALGLVQKDKARSEAIENYKLLNGSDISQVPFEQQEGPNGGPAEVSPLSPEDNVPLRQFNMQTGQEEIIRPIGENNRLQEVTIPGAYGKPQLKLRPRTAREEAAETAARERDDALNKPVKLNEGESLVIPSMGTVASGAPAQTKLSGIDGAFFESKERQLGRPRSQWTQAEMQQAMGQLAEAKQDPQMRALALAVKGMQAGQGGPGGAPGGLAGAVAAGVVGEDALQGVDPGVSRVVKMLADYKMPLPSGMALRTPYWQQVLSLAAAYDPTFDASQYQVRQKLRNDFTSGKSANNIRSLNTAVGHLETLADKATALGNRSLPAWNRIANEGLTNIGDKRVVEFNSAATAVEGELASLFKGTGATDQEIKQWRSSLNTSQSPEQLQGSIQTAIELMGSRLQALNDQYRTGMGKPKDFHLLSDKSRKALMKLGVDVEAIDPGDGPGPSDSGRPTVPIPNRPSAGAGGSGAGGVKILSITPVK